MRKTLKLRKIGNSGGVVLPKELLAVLGASEGDELTVIETPSGLHFNKPDTDFGAHMKEVESITARYPNTPRALAQ